MVALFLLTRSQLGAARMPRPSEVPDPIVMIDTSKMTLALEEGGVKDDNIRIEGTSICRYETGFHHSCVDDSVLNHQVRQRIADRIMWS